jgi:hypothetical protein
VAGILVYPLLARNEQVLPVHGSVKAVGSSIVNMYDRG